MRSFLFRKILLTLFTAGVFLPVASPLDMGTGPNALFYPSSKPLTRWWWFASEIKKEDVMSQLDRVAENGFGGVEIAWVYPINKYDYMTGKDTNYVPRQEWLSKEWSEIFAFTKLYYDRLGLSFDYTFGTGWPFGDTRLPFSDATKVYGETPDDNQNKTYHLVSWEFPGRGYIIDHLDKDCFQRYAERVVDNLVQNIDFAPTFLDYVGINIPEYMQGVSFREIVNGDPCDWRDAIYYHFYEYPSVHMAKRHYGIRTKRYKLMNFYYDVDEWELYDLKIDPSEMNNVYDDPAYAEVKAMMRRRFLELREKYEDKQENDQQFLEEYLEWR